MMIDGLLNGKKKKLFSGRKGKAEKKVRRRKTLKKMYVGGGGFDPHAIRCRTKTKEKNCRFNVKIRKWPRGVLFHVGNLKIDQYCVIMRRYVIFL